MDKIVIGGRVAYSPETAEQRLLVWHSPAFQVLTLSETRNGGSAVDDASGLAQSVGGS